METIHNKPQAVETLISQLGGAGFITEYKKSDNPDVEDDSILIKYTDIQIQVGRDKFCVTQKRENGNIAFAGYKKNIFDVIKDVKHFYVHKN